LTIVKLLQNADTLGIQLVIDYQLQSLMEMRSRHMATVAEFVDQGDWYHLEVAPKFAHDPEATKQAFQAVFGVSPKAAPKPV
jgi:hypothetical protein